MKFVQADSELVYSPVAQLVERLTVNQLVAGSSPARGARHHLANECNFSEYSYFIDQTANIG